MTRYLKKTYGQKANLFWLSFAQNSIESSSARRAGLPIAPVSPGAVTITPIQPWKGCLQLS